MKPAQDQHGLAEHTQRPTAPASTPPGPIGQQQPGRILGKRAGHIDHGTISNHVEPLSRRASGFSDLIFSKSSPSRALCPYHNRSPTDRQTGPTHWKTSMFIATLSLSETHDSWLSCRCRQLPEACRKPSALPLVRARPLSALSLRAQAGLAPAPRGTRPPRLHGASRRAGTWWRAGTSARHAPQGRRPGRNIRRAAQEDACGSR